MIQYEIMIDGASHTRTIDVTEAAAINVAVAHLGADKAGDGYRYHADEIDESVYVCRQAMVEAGAAILAGADDWYSLWCASY